MSRINKSIKTENRLVEGLAGFGGKWGVIVNGVQGFWGGGVMCSVVSDSLGSHGL